MSCFLFSAIIMVRSCAELVCTLTGWHYHHGCEKKSDSTVRHAAAIHGDSDRKKNSVKMWMTGHSAVLFVALHYWPQPTSVSSPVVSTNYFHKFETETLSVPSLLKEFPYLPDLAEVFRNGFINHKLNSLLPTGGGRARPGTTPRPAPPRPAPPRFVPLRSASCSSLIPSACFSVFLVMEISFTCQQPSGRVS